MREIPSAKILNWQNTDEVFVRTYASESRQRQINYSTGANFQRAVRHSDDQNQALRRFNW